ncbi:TadE/TadG family type IV pilus assembly protein [Roseibium salinum]|uniref:Pilus assembly protein n=1 Tax=Roseibium salinum TaxID=1604349 RepID=A0ABT3R551_9HYPH|nr:TadE/TadG family type IV pilus assembly protein [Roseibium sp. DSM 29163]MCX2724147.1 pilus assembly protein [Roseibium sp. DSM 29163]MDN3721791.1 pilus assembly protein [Roseibium salinum]
MILPFMLILLIGMEEVTGALNQDRKVGRIANSIADLVAQAQSVNTSELTAVMDLGEKILAPYPAKDLEIIIASVSFDEDGNPSVDWSYDGTNAAPWAKDSQPPITMPDTIAIPETSIVVGQANATYTSPFTGIFTSYFKRDTSIGLSDTYYLRPRLTDTVNCSDCK